jgi:nucleoside-diphosphate-sugar epimerase
MVVASRILKGEDVTIKSILVTGASGFLGRPLVDQLLNACYSVRATTRGTPSFPASVDAVIIPDFTNVVAWKPILEGIDTIIHLAGLAHTDIRNGGLEAFNSINVAATQNLAIAAKQAGVKRFIFISSIRAQVGVSASRTVHEGDEAHPTDCYGRSKLAAESAVRAAGVPFTILRPVIVYGPHPKGNFKSLVRLALKPLPLPFFGLNNRRSLLGIDNFISAVLFVLNNPSTVGETYLVADSTPLTLPEIVTMLRKAQGRRAGLFYFPPALFRLTFVLIKRRELWARMGEDLVADTTKLRTLGWCPVVDTYEGIVAMMRAESSEDSR